MGDHDLRRGPGMKRIVLAILLTACTEHGRGGRTPADFDPPAACAGHCITEDPGNSSDVCCDSVTCFIDAESGEWVVVFCDPPPPDPCSFCTPDQLCVQAFDGGCAASTNCVDRVVECPNNACTPDCELAYCGDGVSQCENRLPCGTESPLAFTCYGP